jgi:hypothetical protein
MIIVFLAIISSELACMPSQPYLLALGLVSLIVVVFRRGAYRVA